MIFACVDMTQLHSEFLRNPFKGFAATKVKICPFPLLWQFGYWLFLRFVQAIIVQQSLDFTKESFSYLAMVIQTTALQKTLPNYKATTGTFTYFTQPIHSLPLTISDCGRLQFSLITEFVQLTN